MKRLFVHIILCFAALSSCDPRAFKTEEPVVLPPTQFRVVNLSGEQAVSLRINEGRASDSIAPFGVSPYNTQVSSERFQQIDLFSSQGRLNAVGPFPLGVSPAQQEVDESNTVAQVPEDNALFVFRPNTSYDFIVVPDYTGRSLAGSYRLLEADVLEPFPGRSKVRFWNFTNRTRPGVPLPRLYSTNPYQTSAVTGQVTINTNSELVLIQDEGGFNISDYQLIESPSGKRRFFLVLGDKGPNVPSLTYEVPMVNGKVYSLALTGIIDFQKPNEGFGLKLWLIEEGTNSPLQEIAPIRNEEISLRFISTWLVTRGNIQFAASVAYNALGANTLVINFLPALNDFSLGYASFLPPARYNVRITEGSPTPTYFETDFTFEPAKSYTIYPLPTISNSVVDGWILEDDRTSIAGKVRLRFVNASLGAPGVDIYVPEINKAIISNISYKQTSDYVELDALDNASGNAVTYSFEFRQAGRNLFPVDERTGLGGSFKYDFSSGDVVTIVLVGSFEEDGFPFYNGFFSQNVNGILNPIL